MNQSNEPIKFDQPGKMARQDIRYLGHANRCVLETLLDESDAHRVLALLSL